MRAKIRMRNACCSSLALVLVLLAGSSASAATPARPVSKLPRCATFQVTVKGLGTYRWGVYIQDRTTLCSIAKRVLRNAEVGHIKIVAERGWIIRDKGWICSAPSGPIAFVCGRSRSSLTAGQVDFFNLPCPPAGACPRLANPRRR